MASDNAKLDKNWNKQFEIIRDISNRTVRPYKIAQNAGCTNADVNNVLKNQHRLKRWWYRFEEQDDSLLCYRNDLELNQLIYEWMIEKRAMVDPKNGICKFAHQMLALRLALNPPDASLTGAMGFRRTEKEKKYKALVNSCLNGIVVKPDKNDTPETRSMHKNTQFYICFPPHNEIDHIVDFEVQSIYKKIKFGIYQPNIFLQKRKETQHSVLVKECINQVVANIRDDCKEQFERDKREIPILKRAVYDYKDLYSNYSDSESDDEVDSDDELDSDDEMCVRMMAKLYMPANETESFQWMEEARNQEKLSHAAGNQPNVTLINIIEATPVSERKLLTTSLQGTSSTSSKLPQETTVSSVQSTNTDDTSDSTTEKEKQREKRLRKNDESEMVHTKLHAKKSR